MKTFGLCIGDPFRYYVFKEDELKDWLKLMNMSDCIDGEFIAESKPGNTKCLIDSHRLVYWRMS